MTPEQHGSKTERIAELRGRIAALEANNLGGRNITEIGRLSDELSRLRNERGDSKTEEGRGDPLYLALDYVGGMIDELLQFGATDEDLRKIRSRVTKALNEHEATPSPLASVEAGRGEREALEQAAQPFVNLFRKEEQRYRARGGAAAEEIVRQNHKPPFCLTESPTAVFDMDGAVAIIAAAIREDRAEPVSEAEIEASARALCGLRIERNIAFDNKPYPDEKITAAINFAWRDYVEESRRALEAARQARATADEKGGAR